MSLRSFPRLDLAAGLLLLAGMLLATSVLTYDPADLPGDSVFPTNDTPHNLLNIPGAWIAQVLHQTFGLAVYVFLASWFVLVLMFLVRRNIQSWLRRLAGWLLAIPTVSLLADTLAPRLAGGPLAGAGGSLGAWLAQSIEIHAPHAGIVPILAIALFACFVLVSDFALLRWTWRAVRCSVGIAFGLRLRLPRLRLPRLRWPALRWPSLRRRRPATHAAPSVGLETPTEALDDGSIPIHRPTLDTPAEAARVLPISRGNPDQPDDDRFADYELPPLTLLEEPAPFPFEQHDQKLRDLAALLEKTFKDFELNVHVVGINTGPVITQYEIALETGLRVHKVTRLADDIALNLRVPSVRMVAPIPGKNTVGVEIPNEHRAIVRLQEVIRAYGPKLAKAKLPLFLGKDTEGRPLVYDLAEMPHLLIAGRTGTGKSVCMNAIILSMLMTRRPDEVKMIMIDPKMLELSEYGKIPHLMHPVVKDMKKAEAILSWAVDKMEERYDLLSRVRVRSIAGYNELSPEEIHRRLGPLDEEERQRVPDQMPYIVIFIDEMADLMMTMKKEVEGHIIRLAQKSRAAGIHLVVATQKPTVDVITGLIKSNLPSRICFQVASRSDSRVVLDEMGADKLLGKGDMLFLAPGTSTLMRAQGTYASDDEIRRVVEHLECDEPCYAQELVQLNTGLEGGGSLVERLRARDDLYEQAVEVIVREGRGSVSLLQRALGIGYGRAARLVDFMAEDGIVGPYNGANARDVLYTPEQWAQLKAG